jgi:GAF domain-containing protein
MLKNIATRIKTFLKPIWLFVGGFSSNGRTLAPIPFNEEQRQRAVVQYGLNNAEMVEEYQVIVGQAAYACKTPIALVSICDGNRQFFKAGMGLDGDEAPREWAFCGHAIADPYEILEIEDTTLDPRFARNPLVVGPPRIRFYAGVPLISSEGYPLGTLCVIDQEPKKLTEDQKLRLKLLAQNLIVEILSRNSKS